MATTAARMMPTRIRNLHSEASTSTPRKMPSRIPSDSDARKERRRNRGRPEGRGLRGKRAPSADSSTQLGRAGTDTDIIVAPSMRASFTRTQGSIGLNVSSHHRRRIKSDVNLAELLKQETEKESHRKQTKFSRSVPTPGSTNHLTGLLMSQQTGSMHGSTTAEPEGLLVRGNSSLMTMQSKHSNSNFYANMMAEENGRLTPSEPDGVLVRGRSGRSKGQRSASLFSNGSSASPVRSGRLTGGRSVSPNRTERSITSKRSVSPGPRVPQTSHMKNLSTVSLPLNMVVDSDEDDVGLGYDSFASDDGTTDDDSAVEEVERPTQRRSIRMSITDPKTRQSIRRTFSDVAKQASAGQLQKDDNAAYEMEIYPGHFVPFHNGNKVWEAVGMGPGHTMEYTCLDCCVDLVSVIYCEHVICPDCQMVNPVFDFPPGVTPCGAGMGLKQEWIVAKRDSKGALDVRARMACTA